MPGLPDTAAIEEARLLNQQCPSALLYPAALKAQLEADPELAGLHAELAVSHPHLFAPVAVYVAGQDVVQMREYVAAVEALVALPAYQAQALARAPAVAQHRPAASGVMYGFDFHLGPDGPQLIEINTNAGGAMLNLALARAWQACHDASREDAASVERLEQLEPEWLAMFRSEWQSARGDQPLRRIAIVDETPMQQFLAPEFRLFQCLFLRHGIDAVIAAPQELDWDGRELSHQGQPIDLVYNRLTDFYLEALDLAALRQAYLDDAVVLTPHPRAHALYADKRNLELLADAEALAELGASDETIQTLVRGTPRACRVSRAQAETLWAERRRWFFKPSAGYGSKAAYRGDKLTRRVWEEILQGDYIAQKLVPPSERLQLTPEGPAAFKLDIRVYSYRGHAQLFAARLYQGQTTNFRTPGGGFAPVLVL
jgi:hypothetical protein